jgi:succinyl-CoA synthetase beta subunit
MNIHEYQAKQLLAKYGVAVPKGSVVYTPEEAEKAARDMPGPVWVVKAQIHAGGRGKGGGVKVVKSIDDVTAAAQKMLGMTLVTHQTGPKGKEVKRVYIEEGCDIKRELYLGMLLDRKLGRIIMMASTEGGVNIEEVAAKTPEKILKVVIDPAAGFQPHHARRLAYGLKLEGPQIGSAVKFMTALYRAYGELDASMVEINPLVVTGAGEVVALDAKMNFDDNASRTSATSTRRTPPSTRRPRTGSTTSSSPARSAAWSTAPGLPWRRWTSSSSMAATRRTSSTSAAAPPRSG